MSTSADDRLELMARAREHGGVLLVAPAAGIFTCARERGGVLVAGESAGVLLQLGRRATLVVPARAAGTIVSARPERVHAPVGYGDVLYELAPLDVGAAAAASEVERATEAASGGLVLRSPQTGRFYQQPAPGEPPFARAGDVLEAGRPVGLVEVMKTFTHVPYRPGGLLPSRARFLRYLVAHGADVAEGEPLCELELA